MLNSAPDIVANWQHVLPTFRKLEFRNDGDISLRCTSVSRDIYAPEPTYLLASFFFLSLSLEIAALSKSLAISSMLLTAFTFLIIQSYSFTLISQLLHTTFRRLSLLKSFFASFLNDGTRHTCKNFTSHELRTKAENYKGNSVTG